MSYGRTCQTLHYRLNAIFAHYLFYIGYTKTVFLKRKKQEHILMLLYTLLTRAILYLTLYINMY